MNGSYNQEIEIERERENYKINNKIFRQSLSFFIFK